MSKVLITSIGTGQPDVESRTVRYRPARYTNGVSGQQIVETAYVLDAVSKFEEFKETDKIIVVGTAGSDWFSFYEHLRELTGVPVDERVDQIQFKLIEHYEAERKSQMDPADIRKLTEPVKELLEKLYDRAEIIILKYGLDAGQLQDNFRFLQKVSDIVEDGDEIIFDITHAFRSLAFFELITVNYLREVQGKNITIRKVTYGMFEVSREMEGKSPVVDLLPLIDTMDCMKAIDEFKRFGTTYALCDLIEKMGYSDLDREEKKALRALSENISSNDFASFRRMVKNCHRVIHAQDSAGSLVNDRYSQSRIRIKEDTNIRMIANLIYKEIDERFYHALDDDFLLQIEFAKWHFDKKRYVVASVTMVEAIISFAVALCEGSDKVNENSAREIYRQRLNSGYGGSSPSAREFLKCWKELKNIRNHFAHPVNETQIQSDIGKWKECTPKLISLYKKAYMDSADEQVRNNREFLKNALK